MKFFGVGEQDWPSGKVSDRLCFMDPRLEEAIAGWPEWQQERDELIQEGLGFEGKDCSTYSEACSCAKGTPPKVIEDCIAQLRALAPIV